MNLSETAVSSEIQLVVFRLGNSEYALPIAHVKEINRLIPLTKIPKTPSYIEGVINLREEIISVLNLRKRFHLPLSDYSEESRIIIVEVSKETVGIIVDGVAEVIRIKSSSIEPPPPDFMFQNEYISGIGKLHNRLLIILDMNKVFLTQS